MPNHEQPILPENFTDVQQKFADFISQRVKPTARTLQNAAEVEGVVSQDEATFIVSHPNPQFQPIDGLKLTKTLMIVDEPADETSKLPYYEYRADLTDSESGFGVSLSLDAEKAGFTHSIEYYYDPRKVSDDYAQPIVNALEEADVFNALQPVEEQNS